VPERGRLVVVCQVTEACNLGCAFCAYDRRLSRPRESADPGRLLRLAGALSERQRHTGQATLLSWLGGEPLLWPPLGALDAQCRRLGLELGVTTNGTTLGSPAVRAHLLAHYAEVTVSVDGLGALHDGLRAWPGGFAFLRRTVGALAAEKRARGQGPLLRANVVLMRDTVRGLRALALELAAWGIEELTFNQLGGRDRPEFYPGHRLRADDVMHLRATLPALRAELAGHGLRLLGGGRYLDRMAATTAARPLGVADCGAGQRFLFVALDGRLSPCSFTTEALGIPMESVAPPALAEGFAAARVARRPLACDDCHSTQVFGKFERGA